MKPIYMPLFLLVLLASCKKESKVNIPSTHYTALEDFALIPVANARWYVHTQGYVYDDGDQEIRQNTNKKDFYNGVDTTIHFYTVINTTGLDTSIDGVNYHIYSYTMKGVSTQTNPFFKPFEKVQRLYLREDTLGQRIIFNGKTLLDFSDNASGEAVKPFYSWPEMTVQPPSNLIIANQYMKCWNVINPNNKLEYFYKGLGIGCISGILPLGYTGDNGSQVRELDFVYKKDSLHFDYPMY